MSRTVYNEGQWRGESNDSLKADSFLPVLNPGSKYITQDKEGMRKHWRELAVQRWLFGKDSAQFNCSVMSNSLWPHGLQHARLPCPSPTPGAYSNSCPQNRWCSPTISPSVIPFYSLPQSFLASGSFPMSQLFAWGGQSIGVSASASVLPRNIQDWSPLGWTGWVFSNTTVQKHQFFGTQLSL